MNFENPNLGESNEEEKDTAKSTLIKVGAVAAAASALFVGHELNKSHEGKTQGNSDKEFVEGIKQFAHDVEESKSKSWETLLSAYTSNIKSGHSEQITQEESRVRAIEIIHVFRIGIDNNPIEFQTKSGVPYDIKVGNRHVPFSTQSYSPEESKILGLEAFSLTETHPSVSESKDSKPESAHEQSVDVKNNPKSSKGYISNPDNF